MEYHEVYVPDDFNSFMKSPQTRQNLNNLKSAAFNNLSKDKGKS